MKDKIIFGPAGKPLKYKGTAYTSSKYLSERGLKAFEYQSSHGIRIGEESASILKSESNNENILISMHCPYYINMCSKDESKIESSIERLVDSARVGEWMGAYRLVFHPGFYSNQKPDKALKIENSGMPFGHEYIPSFSIFNLHFPLVSYTMLSSQHSGAVRPIIFTMVGATFARP